MIPYIVFFFALAVAIVAGLWEIARRRALPVLPRPSRNDPGREILWYGVPYTWDGKRWTRQ